jgi:hypothetical protein
VKSLKTGILILVLLIACSVPLNGQGKREEYWQPIEPYRISIDASDLSVHELIARWNVIGQDLDTSENHFAGTFEKRAYRGYFLRWSPAKGFVYVFHSEGLSIIDFSYGKVRVTHDAVLFEPEREMKETFRGQKLITPRKWIPITSEKEAFLVPEEQLADFGKYVGGFGEYNDFNGPCCEFSPFFFMAQRSTGQSGHQPIIDIPPTYRRFIREPIKAHITAVGTKRFVMNYGLEGKLYGQLFPRASLMPVVISAGKEQGVLRDQLLRLVGESNNQYLRILIVRKQRSSGVVVRDVDDDGKETYFDNVPEFKKPQKKTFPAIRVGTKVTTSPVLDF